MELEKQIFINIIKKYKLENYFQVSIIRGLIFISYKDQWFIKIASINYILDFHDSLVYIENTILFVERTFILFKNKSIENQSAETLNKITNVMISKIKSNNYKINIYKLDNYLFHEINKIFNLQLFITYDYIDIDDYKNINRFFLNKFFIKSSYSIIGWTDYNNRHYSNCYISIFYNIYEKNYYFKLSYGSIKKYILINYKNLEEIKKLYEECKNGYRDY